MTMNTTTGCWANSPCATNTYTFAQANGLNYQNVGEYFICGGTTACVGHVGITTYSDTVICQATYDVYCDNTKVGSLSTLGKSCIGTAMTNTCNVSFTPVSCSTIKLVITGGSATNDCCVSTGSGLHPDAMVVGISAW